MIDCSKKIQKYSTRSEAINACSRNDDCGAVSQSCVSKKGEKQFFFTCENFFQDQFFKTYLHGCRNLTEQVRKISFNSGYVIF